MKPHLAIAAIACALAACSGLAGPASLPVPSGTDPTPTFGSENSGGGAEPVVSGQDPAPGSTQSIPQLCASLCGREAAAACNPYFDQASCTNGCTSDVSTAGPCQAAYVALLNCLTTATIYCSGTNFEAPECNSAALAAFYCQSGTPTPTTGGSAGGAAGTAP